MNSRKKIGIIALAKPESGGVYQYTKSLIQALSQDNTHRYILFVDRETKNLYSSKNLDLREVQRKRSIQVKLMRGLSLFLLYPLKLGFSKEELKLFSDIDLFVCPYISPYPHYFLNKPFIFTLHDMQERYYPQFFTTGERFRRWLVNRALAKKTVHILCESNYVKNDIVKFLKVSPQKVSVIPAPPPMDFAQIDVEDYIKQEKVKTKYNLPEKYLFYPAQFWYHKNHLKLLEAFKILSGEYKDLHLVFTGYPKNNYENILKKIKELGLERKVKILGYVDYEDLPYIYKMALVLVMPSLFESISIPIYEAFAVGTPVCASNVCAIPEQVGDAGLTFDPNDPEDMAKKIRLLLNDDTLRKKLVNEGYKRLSSIRVENYKNAIVDIIGQVLKNHYRNYELKES